MQTAVKAKRETKEIDTTARPVQVDNGCLVSIQDQVKLLQRFVHTGTNVPSHDNTAIGIPHQPGVGKTAGSCRTVKAFVKLMQEDVGQQGRRLLRPAGCPCRNG